MRKDDEYEMARRRLSENMIRINVYFGYKFFVIKILSVHTILRIVIFDFFFRHSVTADSRLVSRMCRGKKKHVSLTAQRKWSCCLCIRSRR